MYTLTRRHFSYFISKNIRNVDISFNTIKFQRCFSKTTTYFGEKKDEGSRELVIVEKVDKLRLIGINRPEKRNCVNRATATALLNAFKEFDADDDSYVAVLYGKGGNFCAGFDLSEVSDPETFMSEEEGPMGPTRYETKKPVFAAIEGYAVGGGFELALWCDYRVMEENAIMGCFNRRYGVPLIDGGPSRLPAIVGLGKALDIIMIGRPIKIDEALECGLVNKKCAVGTAIGQASYIAMSLVDYPQAALRADRESARKSYGASSLSEALVNEHRRGMAAMDEAKEGAKLFMKGKGKHGVIFNHVPEDFDEY